MYKYIYMFCVSLFLGIASSFLRAAEVLEESGSVILRNQKIAFYFDADNLTLQRIIDRTRSADFIAKPGGRLFTVAMWAPSNPDDEILNHPRHSTSYNIGKSVDSSSASSYTYDVEKEPNGVVTLKLHYWQNRFKGMKGTIDVTICVTLGDNDGISSWLMSLDNHTDYELFEVHFPRLESLGSKLKDSASSEYLLLPVNSSQVLRHPRVNAYLKYFYPNCMSMQMVGYADGQGGILYYAAHDAMANRKELVACRAKDKKSFLLEYRIAADKRAKKHWKMPYVTKVGVLSGDWYDAAIYYRKKFADKIWKTFFQRKKELASWFINNCVWVHGGAAHQKGRILSSRQEMEELVERLLRLRNLLGEDFGFHWYVWHKHITFDQYYPDYLPARPDFLPAVTALEKSGVHCMPYVNSHLFDRNLPEWHDSLEVQESTIQDIVPGRHDIKVYNMVTMCHGTEFWRNRIVDVQRAILHFYPVSALYMDEIGSLPELCYARNHEHQTHGGTFYGKGQRTILRQMRDALEWSNRKPVIAGEGMSETHINLLDGSISGHVDLQPNAVPAFQVVHGDRISQIGLRMTMEELQTMDRFMAKIGWALARGKQLGWFETFMLSNTYDLTLPKVRPAIEKLKECTALRRAGLNFLFFGRMLRPPKIALGGSKVQWDIHIPFMRAKQKHFEMVPWVYSSCYQSATGDIGIVLVNRSAQERTVRIPWNSEDWSFKSGQKVIKRVYKKMAWQESESIPLPAELKVTLPAYTPILMSFSRL